MKNYFVGLLLLLVGTTRAQNNNNATCSAQLLETCVPCLAEQDAQTTKYDCSSPGLESYSPGQYEGVTGM